MKKNKMKYHEIKQTSTKKQLIDVEQIKNISNINPVIQFCGFIAEKMNYNEVALFTSISDTIFSEENLKKSLPLLIFQSEIIDNWDESHWNNINELMKYVPYSVLFFHTPNLSSLNAATKENIINETLETFSDQRLTIDHIGWSYQSYSQAGLIITLSNDSKITKLIPKDFKVIAIIAVRNEEDIIKHTIKHLYNQGIDIYIIDNWSTDKTIQKIEGMIGKEILDIEKWPKNHPPEYFSLEGILKRKEVLAQELDADWFMHYDTDEFRESPWKNLTLREALWKVDQLGYNAVDFTYLNFRPTDNNYSENDNPLNYFKYSEFGDRAGHFKRINAWKKQNENVDLHSYAGHKVNFPNQKVFPIKFLTRHYPFRSQAHAEKKIIKDRINRLDPEGLKKGWHTHYKNFNLKKDILKNKNRLIFFNKHFYYDYLIERLTGIGILTKPLFMNEPRTTITPDVSTNLETKVSDLEQEILFYTQSKSWNFTRPFRKIVQFIKSML
jgi:hypothetical protein